MSTPKETIIQVKDLSYSFKEGTETREVLHKISENFNSGEIVIITGPSGSGKTTLLKLIGGLRTIQQGSIRIAGQELRQANKKELTNVRRNIGFIFQTHHLLSSLNIVQNVMMPLAYDRKENSRSARKKASDLLRDIGLGEHLHKTPELLSGGQKQRVAIARALVHKPRIVLADEPTASLDGNTGREIVNILEKLARASNATILLVTHDPRIHDVADRIIKLEDGRIQ